jgi:hypothetical protein
VIYEFRTYTVLPGRMPALLRRFETKTIPIWERHGIKQIGFFTTMIGPESRKLTYILQYDSLADREARWGPFQKDVDWIAARTESEKDGQIVENMASEILMPTSFSALK